MQSSNPAHTKNISKRSLVILHKQNKRLVQVRQEKNAAVTALNSIRKEKEAVEVGLKVTRDDLKDANACMEQTYPGRDIWNKCFNELADLAEAGQYDGVVILKIILNPLYPGLRVSCIRSSSVIL